MAQPSPQTASEQFGTNLHPANDAACATAERQPDGIGAGPSKPSEAVGRGLPHRLTESEREAAIVRAEVAEAKYEAKWVAFGCFAAKGDADRARRLKLILIAGRTGGANAG